MIIFVGDKASKKNIDPYTPFVGTQSYKRLLEWVFKLDIDISETLLVNREGVRPYVRNTPEDVHVEFNGVYTSSDYVKGDKIIALGKAASKLLKKHFVPHFEMPHPSGLNRKINDKKYIDKMLKACKTYIHS